MSSVKVRNHAMKFLQRIITCSIQRHGLWGKSSTSKHISYLLSIRHYTKLRPPWRILFFGTDEFAVESLKRLTSTSEEIVESLKVVTLANDNPVKRFAEINQLPVHTWPPEDLASQFDVGVVVSFGCLLHERLINQFPYGILNVHPSLLPRWRGSAPVFHTILNGDSVTGVTIMLIRPQRFDVGPILNQETYQIPPNCTSEQLGCTLATRGANLLIDTLKTLPEKIANKREQSQMGATLAPKIHLSMSWLVWEEQTCDQIDRLFRAIGTRIPLRTIWMGKTVKLLDFVGKCHISLSDQGRIPVPGLITFIKESNILAVACKDGWVGFRTVVLKKNLTAADFYNGYLHQSLLKKSQLKHECQFISNGYKNDAGPKRKELSDSVPSYVHHNSSEIL